MTLTAEDKAVRATRIGASEVAAVLGISPYADATPFAVWARLTQGIQRPDAPELTAGQYLERAVADWYRDTMDVQLLPVSGQAHPEHPWLSATPDREVHDGDFQTDSWLLECKTDRDRDAWGEPGTDQVPVHIAAQVQIQMACTGLARCDVAVLFKSRDEFACYTVPRDQAVIDAIIAQLGSWYVVHVTGGVMPALDGGNAAAEYLRRRYPTSNGTYKTPLPDQVFLIRDWQTLKAAEKESGDKAEVMRQRIILEIGETDGFTFPDGERISYRADKRGRRSLRMSGQKDE